MLVSFHDAATWSLLHFDPRRLFIVHSYLCVYVGCDFMVLCLVRGLGYHSGATPISLFARLTVAIKELN